MLKISIFSLFIFLLFQPIMFSSENDKDDVNLDLAKETILKLIDGNSQFAVEQFDSTMSSMLNAERLDAGIGQIKMMYGDFIKIDTIDVISNFQFSINLEFETHFVSADLSYNNDLQITGLFFRPTKKKENEIAELYPEYIDTNRFEEKKIKIESIELIDGILTIPKTEDSFPLIILNHGSGRQDKDLTIGPNKFFKQLAWGLASNGIAVMRFDKLTYIDPRIINEKLPELTIFDEFNLLAKDALDYLISDTSLNYNSIVMLAHSQSGTIIPSLYGEKNIDGFIIMAGTTRKIYDLFKEQMIYIFNLDNTLSATERERIEEIENQIDYFNKYKDSSSLDITKLPMNLPLSYLKSIDEYDAMDILKKNPKPTLILSGESDYQVPPKDFELMKEGLKENKNYNFILFNKLNHIFAVVDGVPTPNDYSKKSNIAPEVFIEIKKWIDKIKEQ